MIGWALRKVQGPSFGQTRRSSLHEFIEDFEEARADFPEPLSRKEEREKHESVALKRDAPSQIHRD